jgi:hypothetical protein
LLPTCTGSKVQSQIVAVDVFPHPRFHQRLLNTRTPFRPVPENKGSGLPTSDGDLDQRRSVHVVPTNGSTSAGNSDRESSGKARSATARCWPTMPSPFSAANSTSRSWHPAELKSRAKHRRASGETGLLVECRSQPQMCLLGPIPPRTPGRSDAQVPTG